MQYVATLNRLNKPNPYSWTKIMVTDAAPMDTVIAELGNERGKSSKVTIQDALEVYALWAVGRLSNSKSEKSYMLENNNKQLPAYSL